MTLPKFGVQAFYEKQRFTSPQTPEPNKKRKAEPTNTNNRRIKDVRKRPRAATPAGASQQAGTAFSSLSTAPSFPSSGFSAPPVQSNGFNFGQTQSQSFPGASSTPSQPNQSNTTPFSFGSGSQPGFSFSGFGGSSSAAATNPFATTSFTAGNSTPSQQQNTPFSFGGFGGNQSTPQQQSFSSGPFGAQTPSTPNGAGLFGQPANNTGANSAADSMQTSPDAKPKTLAGNTSPTMPPLPSSLNRSLFGDSGASDSLSSKPATPAGNIFSGIGASSTASASNPFTFTSTPKPAEPEKVNGTQKAPLFGAATPSTSQAGANPAPSATPSLFAAKPAAPASNPFAGLSASSTAEKPPASNPFAFTSTPKPAEPEKTNVDQKAPFFGAATPSASQAGVNSTPSATPSLFSVKPAAPASNPFAGISASSTASTAEKPQASSPFTFTSTPKPAEPEKVNGAQKAPLFGAATPSASQAEVKSTPSATPSLFAAKPAAPASNPFAGLSASSTAEKPPASNPFAFTSTPKPAEPEKVNGAQKAPLFGAATPSASQAEVKSTPSATPSLFAAKPAAPASNPFAGLSASSTAEKPPASNPFAFTSTPKPAEPEKVNTAPSPASSLFATKPAEKPADRTSPTPNDMGAQIPIPKFGEMTQELQDKAIILWKIRTLDIFFQEQIAKSKPGEELFDNIILHYMKARASFGYPVKRRNQLSNGAEETPTQNGQLAQPNSENGSATANMFAKSFSSPGPVAPQFGNDSPAPAAPKFGNGSPAPAAPKFGNGSPAPAAPKFGDGSSTPAAPKFGDGSSTPAAPKFGNGSPAPAAPKFGDGSSTPAAPQFGTGSPAPAAPKFGNGSPAPAAPKFGNGSASSVPKFGSGTSGPVDFMAQFKKTAESTEAKEKAKRKAEEFDSDEDDEEEWERRDAEKQREKRAKFAADVAKIDAGKSVWIPGQGLKSADSDKSATPTPADKPSPPATSSPSIFESSSRPLSDSENIFGRISTPQPVEDDKDSDDSDAENKPASPKRRTGEKDTDPLCDAKRAKSSETAEVTKSSLDTPIPAPTAEAGQSLFSRIQSPAPQSESSSSPKPNPFGALSQGTSLFGNSPADKTWKPSEPIKFGASSTTSTQAPEKVDAEANDDETAPGAIFNLAEDAAETEGEECVFKCRARAFKLGTGWVSQGTGFASLLVHESGRARIVLRADPSGSVILNTLLKKDYDYSLTNNSVQFMVPQVDGPLEHWAVRVKAESVKAFHDKVNEIKY
ncbi:hypothetical protein N7520_004102 [Penicillium odoratum]|uniref:uncharacterized protein n=1 Tax=Penicillium odoratum TaxID=1167516 RepID=UPI002547FAFA|nr:uncharacterized protein N7520_004102 [Penicillium odoratum]KAJ5769543.1 hypothetical protein N7520_004102 [Penicillium odoratum]